MNRSSKPLHIVDIARLSGVSPATVSRVMTGSRPVSPPLRERVLATARRFDYQPSQLARNLRRGRTATVGVLVSDIENPHFSKMVRFIEEALYARGIRVLFCNSAEDSRKQSAYLEVMAAERVMGVVISPTAEGDAAVSNLMDLGTPVVAIDRPVADPRADVVVADHAHAMAAGTQLLIDSGRRHIGWIGGREGIWTTTERLAGYSSTIRRAGLEPVSQLGEFTAEMGYRAAERLLDGHPELDGLMIANNLMVIGVLQALRQRAVRVPDQLGIVAFDDPPWANLVEPPLTTIAQPIREMSEAAVDRLFLRLDDPSLPPRRICLECHLEIRASSRHPSQ
ncbi:MAG TPA: LacI family DNA-binding transcriptional regulator [Verrucomicrobiae bacterium]|nr:LacI family DNA-binding transcriptional regulator [Verrucomicrobiae bacterium]